jgi:hypothetical protein
VSGGVAVQASNPHGRVAALKALKGEMMTDVLPDLVPGRSCGTCTMCCKLLEIDVLKKPRGVWCTHCNPKSGCTIYETRPEPCRSFNCGYLRLPGLDDRWKPAKARFLINYETAAGRIAIHADLERPDAWKAEPYAATIKQWSLNAARQGSYVIVWAGRNATLVLPGRLKELGPVRDDQLIVAVDIPAPGGTIRDFIVVEPDDPRAMN